MSSSGSCSDWETSKENIQPLAGGRRMSSLSLSLQRNDTLVEEDTETQDKIIELEAKMRSKTVDEGGDELDGFVTFISYLQQHRLTCSVKYGPKYKEAILLCIRTFVGRNEYNNDRRFVDIYLKSLSHYPVERRINLLHSAISKGIGRTVSKMFIALAEDYEAICDIRSASETLREGLNRKAQPTEELQAVLINLESRFALKLANEMRDGCSLDGTRSFGSGVPIGPQNDAESIRIDLDPALPFKTQQQQQHNYNKSSTKVSIYHESSSSMSENCDWSATSSRCVDPVEEMEFIRNETENRMDPTKWNSNGVSIPTPILLPPIERVELYVEPDDEIEPQPFRTPLTKSLSRTALKERKIETEEELQIITTNETQNSAKTQFGDIKEKKIENNPPKTPFWEHKVTKVQHSAQKTPFGEQKVIKTQTSAQKTPFGEQKDTKIQTSAQKTPFGEQKVKNIEISAKKTQFGERNDPNFENNSKKPQFGEQKTTQLQNSAQKSQFGEQRDKRPENNSKKSETLSKMLSKESHYKNIPQKLQNQKELKNNDEDFEEDDKCAKIIKNPKNSTYIVQSSLTLDDAKKEGGFKIPTEVPVKIPSKRKSKGTIFNSTQFNLIAAPSGNSSNIFGEESAISDCSEELGLPVKNYITFLESEKNSESEKTNEIFQKMSTNFESFDQKNENRNKFSMSQAHKIQNEDKSENCGQIFPKLPPNPALQNVFSAPNDENVYTPPAPVEKIEPILGKKTPLTDCSQKYKLEEEEEEDTLENVEKTEILEVKKSKIFIFPDETAKLNESSDESEYIMTPEETLSDIFGKNEEEELSEKLKNLPSFVNFENETEKNFNYVDRTKDLENFGKSHKIRFEDTKCEDYSREIFQNESKVSYENMGKLGKDSSSRNFEIFSTPKNGETNSFSSALENFELSKTPQNIQHSKSSQNSENFQHSKTFENHENTSVSKTPQNVQISKNSENLHISVGKTPFKMSSETVCQMNEIVSSIVENSLKIVEPPPPKNKEVVERGVVEKSIREQMNKCKNEKNSTLNEEKNKIEKKDEESSQPPPPATKLMFDESKLLKRGRVQSFEHLRASAWFSSLSVLPAVFPLPPPSAQSQLESLLHSTLLPQLHSLVSTHVQTLFSNLVKDEIWAGVEAKVEQKCREMCSGGSGVGERVSGVESEVRRLRGEVERLNGVLYGRGTPGGSSTTSTLSAPGSGTGTLQQLPSAEQIKDGYLSTPPSYEDGYSAPTTPYPREVLVETFADETLGGVGSYADIETYEPTVAHFNTHELNLSNLTHALRGRPEPGLCSTPERMRSAAHGYSYANYCTSPLDLQPEDIRELSTPFVTPHPKKVCFNQTLQDVCYNLSTIQETSKESRSSTASSSSSNMNLHFTTTGRTSTLSSNNLSSVPSSHSSSSANSTRGNSQFTQ